MGSYAEETNSTHNSHREPRQSEFDDLPEEKTKKIIETLSSLLRARARGERPIKEHFIPSHLLHAETPDYFVDEETLPEELSDRISSPRIIIDDDRNPFRRPLFDEDSRETEAILGLAPRAGDDKEGELILIYIFSAFILIIYLFFVPVTLMVNIAQIKLPDVSTINTVNIFQPRN